MKRLVGFFAIALVGGLTALALNHFFFSSNSEPRSFEERQQVRFANQEALSGDAINFVDVAERATPTVVHIKTTIEAASTPPDMFDPFGFFNNPGMQAPQQQGSGSGVLITNDGYIATNNHVIDGASKIEVVLNDKRSYTAELIGKDPETDLALLKIEEKGLNFLSFGNSDELRIGEWVIAVGNPFNLTSTVTAGIVSAKGRNINLLRQNGGEWAIENFIQTDAAVNPGNSGGALVNTRGELVGINTAIASRTGSYAGYAFAIPVNLAKKILDDLLKYGEVKRAVLGVRIQDITAELADEKGIRDLEGVYIPEVVKDGAADKAGVKDGDIILSINGTKLNKASELQEEISKFYPGDKVKLKLIRDGKEIEKEVTLRSKEGDTKVVTEVKREEKEAFGATFENLSRDEKLNLKVRNGVRLSKVKKGPFADKGISEGFIITHIDKKRVYTTQDVVSQLKAKSGTILVEGVLPNGESEAYALRLPEQP
ncbi:MAG: Do family serine endopeptidase [Flavobacteriales bacterium]|nr:Do family serine endopeptidase [Flavobacteriales bacterium]